ncbi:MAG: type II toxin-antitoxin system VapC family toxin [Spartobacteria bacterium]
MRILIDTHALIWFCEGNTNLSDKARKAMQDDAIEKFISPAVPWEMAIKISIGKLTLKTDFSSLFPGVVSANGFHILALHFSHFEYLMTMPKHHTDPFDRIMIAQALSEDCSIVTIDPNFAKYSAKILW